LLTLLEARGTEIGELRLLASERSRGRTIEFAGRELTVQLLEDAAFDGIDVAFFSCGKERSKRYAPAAVERGALVIDNSSAFRLDADVPLIVPEVNAAAMPTGSGGAIIANPNCSTILMVVPLAPLHQAFGLESVVVSTYQAASGAGQKGIEALLGGVRSYMDGPTDGGAAGEATAGETEVFGHRLAFNLVPHIDTFADDGVTGEERKMVLETRKIMGLPELPVDVTCVRVPVLRCHSEAVTIATREAITPDLARAALQGAPGVRLVDDPTGLEYPMPVDADGVEPVLVGRVRDSAVFENGISFWLSGDQLLKGAALNAVQIFESYQDMCGPQAQLTAPAERRED
jgi:aspartate-semialdehyde dehydrogenase